MDERPLQGQLLDEEDVAELLTPGALAAYRACRDPSRSVNQDVLYALIRRSLAGVRMGSWGRGLADIARAFLITCAFGLLFLMGIPALGLLFSFKLDPALRLAGIFGPIQGLFIPLAVVAAARRGQVELDESGGRVDRLRLEGFYRVSKLGFMLGMIVIALAGQIMLLAWGPTWLGIRPVDLTLKQATLVSLDTLLRGGLLDLFESYNLSIGPPQGRTTFAASTLLFLFRSLHAGLLAVFLFTLWRIMSQRKFTKPFETDTPDFTRDIASLDKGPQGSRLLPQAIFLKTAAMYIRNAHEIARFLARMDIARVNEPVQRLLVLEDGNRIYPVKKEAQYEREDWQPPPSNFRIERDAVRKLKAIARSRGVSLVLGAPRRPDAKSNNGARQYVCLVFAEKTDAGMQIAFRSCPTEMLPHKTRVYINLGLPIAIASDAMPLVADVTILNVGEARETEEALKPENLPPGVTAEEMRRTVREAPLLALVAGQPQGAQPAMPPA